jgi:hypothetical protein
MPRSLRLEFPGAYFHVSGVMSGFSPWILVFSSAIGFNSAKFPPTHENHPFDISPSISSTALMKPPAPCFFDFFAGSGLVMQVAEIPIATRSRNTVVSGIV